MTQKDIFQMMWIMNKFITPTLPFVFILRPLKSIEKIKTKNFTYPSQLLSSLEEQLPSWCWCCFFISCCVVEAVPCLPAFSCSFCSCPSCSPSWSSCTPSCESWSPQLLLIMVRKGYISCDKAVLNIQQALKAGHHSCFKVIYF